jgi:hypothetical protein
VIELGLADEPSAARAHAVLARSGADAPELEGTKVRLTSDDGARSLVDALRLLDAEGIVAAALTVREPSLDDVFLALTGRHAEEAAA